MQWVAESDRNWSPAAPDKAMEIIKGDNEVVLRLNIVGQEVVIDPARPMPDYTFALAATPLKPIEKDHWEMRFHHISQTTHGPVDMRLNVPDEILDKLAAGGVKTVCFHEHWTQCQAYSSTPFEADLDSFVKRCHQRGMKVLLYFGFNISDLIPEWPYIGEDCVVHPKSGYLPSNYPPQPIQNAYIVCLNSAYQDLLADGVARLVDRFDIDGVYLDTTTVPFACCNEAHGCGYRKPDGTLVSTFPVFSVRQMLRRMYTIIRQRKPDGLVDAHVYDGMTAPALAWATSYWTGEQLRRTENYAEGMPLDRFRAECMGRNWGVPAEFLYYMLGSYRNGYALALLHDVEVRPAGLKEDFELGKSVWKVMDDFGRKQSQWYPYWSNQEYVKVSVADCYASLYHHPTNGVLVVVSNLGGKEAAIELTLNREKLGLAGTLTTKDALTGQHVDAVQGTVTTKLPSVGWQMIWVKP